VFSLSKSGIFAGAAFLLSFLLGLISGTHLPMLLVRPVIFAVLFFIISGLVSFLVNRFLPELLEKTGVDEGKSSFFPGSRINITEGDNQGDALSFMQENSPASSGRVPLGAQPDNTDNGMGDISSLLLKNAASQVPDEGAPQGLDQEAQDGYNKSEDVELFPGAEPLPSEETVSRSQAPFASNGGGSDSADILPDLDSMAGAFLPASSGEESDTTEYSVSAPSQKPLSKAAKTPAWTGDFNAKDLAAGLRTILNKEKEG